MTSSLPLKLGGSLMEIPDMTINISNVGVKNLTQKRTGGDGSVTF